MFSLLFGCFQNKYEEFEKNLMQMGIVIRERNDIQLLAKYLHLYVRKCFLLSTNNKVAAKVLDIPRAKDEALYMISNVQKFTGQTFKLMSNEKVKTKQLPVSNEIIRKILDPEKKCEIFQHDRFVTRPNQILFNYSFRLDNLNLSIDWSWETMKCEQNGIELYFYFDNTPVFTSHDLIRLKCYSIWKLIYNTLGKELRKILLTIVFSERQFEFYMAIEKSLKKDHLTNYCSWMFEHKFESEFRKLRALSFALSVCVFHSDVHLPQSIYWIEMLDLYSENDEMTELILLHYVRNTSIGCRTFADFWTNHQSIFALYTTEMQAISNVIFRLKDRWIDEKKRYSYYDLFVCKRSTNFFRLFYFNNKLFENVSDWIKTNIEYQNLRKVLLLQLCKVDYLVKLGNTLEQRFPYVVIVEIINAMTDDGIILSLQKDPYLDFEVFL